MSNQLSIFPILTFLVHDAFFYKLQFPTFWIFSLLSSFEMHSESVYIVKLLLFIFDKSQNYYFKVEICLKSRKIEKKF